MNNIKKSLTLEQSEDFIDLQVYQVRQNESTISFDKIISGRRKKVMAEIRKARKELDAGKGVPYKKVLKKIK